MSKTKARTGPPPSKSGTQRLQMTIPMPADVPDNLSTKNDDVASMNFKVPNGLHMQFKMEAAARGWSMRKLLETSFAEFLERHGHAHKSDDLFIKR